MDSWRSYFWLLVASFTAALAAGPIVRRIAMRLNLYDRPDAGLKPHDEPIPYLGGLAIYVGWLAALVVGVWMNPAIGSRASWFVAAGSLIMLTGLIDDIRHLRPRVRLLVQVAAAGLLLHGGVGRRTCMALLDPFAGSLPDWLFAEPLLIGISGLVCVFILAGAANATNLIDGLDGLCAGVIGIASIGFVLVSAILARLLPSAGDEHALRTVLALGSLGGCLGFLRYNFNPASMFMGDGGSLLLGFNVAAVLITLAEHPSWRWLAGALIVFGFPIFDTGLAIARRSLNGKPLFVGDRSHFYDQVRDRGLSVRKTVAICYAMGVAFAGMGVGVLFLSTAWLVAALIAMPLLLALACWRLGLLRVDDAAARSEQRPGAPNGPDV